jgi:hypothetical protein
MSNIDYDKNIKVIRELAERQLWNDEICRKDYEHIQNLLSAIPRLLQCNQLKLSEKYIRGCYTLLGM